MDDEKDAGFVLKQDAIPYAAKSSYRFRGRNSQQKTESIISPNGKDRRLKYNELFMSVASIKTTTNQVGPVDITKFIVQLRMQFGADQYYVGTGTIFRIVENTIFILTCAHNVVSFHEFKNEKYYAKKIWFKFAGQHVAASKFFIYPGGYKRGDELGKDLAVIISEVSFPFMFYHTFPTLGYKYVPWVSNILKSSILFKNTFSWLRGKGDDVEDSDDEDSDKDRKYEAAIYGYPGEKRGEFWGMEGTVFIVKEKNDVFSYDNIDTTGGQSGSPIFVDGQIVGVHTNGDYLGAKENYGTMLNAQRIRWINDLIPCQVGKHPKEYRKEIDEYRKQIRELKK